MKFGRKLMYLNYLHELAQHLQLDQLIIPPAVRKLVLPSLCICELVLNNLIHVTVGPFNSALVHCSFWYRMHWFFFTFLKAHPVQYSPVFLEVLMVNVVVELEL